MRKERWGLVLRARGQGSGRALPTVLWTNCLDETGVVKGQTLLERMLHYLSLHTEPSMAPSNQWVFNRSCWDKWALLLLPGFLCGRAEPLFLWRGLGGFEIHKFFDTLLKRRSLVPF